MTSEVVHIPNEGIKMCQEYAKYKYRKPPRNSFESVKNIRSYGPYIGSKRITFLSKGLMHKQRYNETHEDYGTIPPFIWDTQDIGVIEDLRNKRNYYHAILKAAAHADFQGKRILALKYKSKDTTVYKKTFIEKFCRSARYKLSPSRLVRLDLEGIIKLLWEIDIINGEEYITLDNVRNMSNDLRHIIDADYLLDDQQADKVLIDTVQILLRLRELPPNINEDDKIKGDEWENFWNDIFQSYQKFKNCV